MKEVRTAGALSAAGAGVGAAVTSTLSSVCCVGPVIAPLMVGVLGASGAAWAASLKPYSLYLLLASAALLAYTFWSLYRPRPQCDAVAPTRAAIGFHRTAVIVAWLAAVLWVAALVIRIALG